jgi:ribosomal protein L12E/L44/L45/RPP1/RPP2
VQVSELRERLKAKGAHFKDVPTVDQIRKAKARKDKERDMEGIDMGNVVEGARRRAAETPPPVAKAKASSKAPPPKAASGSEEESSSEEELEF